MHILLPLLSLQKCCMLMSSTSVHLGFFFFGWSASLTIWMYLSGKSQKKQASAERCSLKSHSPESWLSLHLVYLGARSLSLLFQPRGQNVYRLTRPSRQSMCVMLCVCLSLFLSVPHLPPTLLSLLSYSPVCHISASVIHVLLFPSLSLVSQCFPADSLLWHFTEEWCFDYSEVLFTSHWWNNRVCGLMIVIIPYKAPQDFKAFSWDLPSPLKSSTQPLIIILMLRTVI